MLLKQLMMKKTILAIIFSLLILSACEDKCKYCTYKVYYIEDTNIDTLYNDVQYCGEYLDIVEQEPANTTVGNLRRERICN